MDYQHQIALDKAVAWIEENFKPVGIIATGTIVRGNARPGSDLDIYVIHEEEFRQRIQKYFEGVPCEIFVNTREHVYKYFEEDFASNRPITAHMISTGTILKGEERDDIKKLIDSAKEYLVKAPEKNARKETNLRYMIATLFEDGADVKDSDPVTCKYYLDQAVISIVEYTFLKNCVAMVRPKERIKFLTKNFPEEANLITEYYSSEGFEKSFDTAKLLVEKSVGETGFFEWDSGRE